MSRRAASSAERGRWAEDLACEYLRARGLRVLERNYRSRRGEIDIVLSAGEALVFVEVRYRSRSDFGSAAESVDGRKRARLVAAARHFLQHRAEGRDLPCRFDVIAVSPSAGSGHIEWIRDAFQ